MLGTPEFMAPEQCQGAQVTPATDVYALGCCLFALIAGRPPFVDAATTTRWRCILQHLREPPPRLDALVPEVSPAGRRSRREVPREGSEGSARRTPPRCSTAIEQLCDGSPR